jgi:hypothetical protein
MRLARRFLGFLWTLAAAVPVVAHRGEQAGPSRPSVSAAGGARSESRSTVGQVRIGLGETVLRDLRTPFVGSSSFRLELSSRIVNLDARAVRLSRSQAVRRSNRARAPPNHS